GRRPVGGAERPGSDHRHRTSSRPGTIRPAAARTGTLGVTLPHCSGIVGRMRWCTYVSPADSAQRVGLLHEGQIHGLPGEGRLVELLGDDGERMAKASEPAVHDPAEVVGEDRVRFLAPVPEPPSIRDFYAFEEHVKTSAQALGREVSPVWYEIPL